MTPTSCLRRATSLIEGIDREGTALLLHGHPGSGKSTLLDAARDVAVASGFQVIRTAGVPSEAHMPMSGLHRLVRPLMRGVEALSAEQRAALEACFGHGGEVYGAALATLELLAQAAADRPVVALVDDLHWLDQSSREVIGFLARRIASERIVLLATLRTGYDDQLENQGVDSCRLGALSGDEAAELLESRAPGLKPGTQARLLGEAAGNPLALVELAHPATLAAVARGVAGPLPVTTRLEHAFAARFRDLPSSTATLVLLLAAHDSGAAAEVLAAGRMLTGSELGLADLQPAIDGQIIDVSEDGLRFRHPLTRSAIYQAVGLQERHGAHAALIEVLAGQPDRQTWHRAAATTGCDESVAQAMLARAQHAHARGATLEAATSLGRAAELSPDPDRRIERLLQAAELASDAGRAELVCAFVDEAHTLAPTPRHRARASLVTESLRGGEQISSVVAHARQAGRDGDSELAIRLLLGASARSWWADPGEAVRDRVLRAVEDIRIGCDDPRRLATIAFAAPVTHGALVSQHLPAALEAGIGDARTEQLLGRAAHAIADFDVSLRVLGTADEGLRDGGQFGLLTHVVVTRAWTSMLVGDWDTAATAASDGLRLARETSQPLWGAWALATLAALAGARGDDSRAAQLATEAEEILAPARVSSGLAIVQTARGLSDLSAGRYNDAFANLGRCLNPSDPAYHHREQFGAVGFYADAAALTGRQDEARGVIARLSEFTVSSSAGLASSLAYALPILATDDDAEQAFVQTLAADGPVAPFDRARQQLFYGMWLRRQRRVIEARELLRVARAAFDAIDAPSWSARASQELRAAGAGHGRQAEKAWSDLSAQELQIAQLAAAGLSNRDIAQRLYLSHRTVASHLNRIFPKLGISSRSQLNGVLPGRSGASLGTVAS